MLKLIGYDYLVEYKKGRKIWLQMLYLEEVGSLLLRTPSLASSSNFLVFSTTIVQPIWLVAVQKMVEQSPYFQTIQRKSVIDSPTKHHYKLLNSIWFYKNKVVIDPSSPMCEDIFMIIMILHQVAT